MVNAEHKLQYVNLSNNPDPFYKKDGDAGFDLRVDYKKQFIEENDDDYPPIVDRIAPGCRAIIGTGLYFRIKEGYFGSLRDRSGLAAKHGVTILGGVVDSNYRGEVKIVVQNHGTDWLEITQGMRLAQMIIQKHETVVFDKQDPSILEEWKKETERQDAGFGASGLN